MNVFEMMKNVKSLQNNLADIEVTGYSGADMVKVTLNGNFEVKELVISQEALRTNDSAVISELVKVAFRDTITKVQRAIQQQDGELRNGGYAR